MRRLVGVIGHVDHGKTTLVHALTGMQTDRLAEERARGISIALGFAYLETPAGTIDLIDMPGHERFVRTMVAGATGLDAVLLVVDAREGIKPQTVEHLDIAGLLGIRTAFVAISKTDLVSAAAAAARAAQVAAHLEGSGLSVAGCVLTSALSGAGVAELGAMLAGPLPAGAPDPAAARTPDFAGGRAPGQLSEPERGGGAGDDDGFAYLPVDRAFTIAGHGTVVTGTLRRGALAVTDDVVIAPKGARVRLRGLQVHGRRVQQARPGQRVAANLRDVSPGDVGRGTTLATPGALVPATWLTVALRLVPGAPPIGNGARLMLLCATFEIAVRLRLLDAEEALPGAIFMAQLHAPQPICAPARERFILRSVSPPRTLGGGWVIDPAAVRLRRHVPVVLDRLRGLAEAAPAELVGREIRAAGEQGVQVARLAQLGGIAPARAIAVLGPDGLLLKDAAVSKEARAPKDLGVAIDRAAFARVQAQALAILRTAGASLTLGALLAGMPATNAAVLEAAVAVLVEAGKLRRDGAALQAADPARDQARAAAAAQAERGLAEILRRAGLSPPEPQAIAPGPATRALVDRLVRQGVLVRAPDPAQGREIIFHYDAVTEARRVLAGHLAPPGLLVREAGAVLGISRKYSVPLLEYFDAVKFTRRVADRRVLA